MLEDSSPQKLLMVNLSKTWGGGEKWFLTVGKGLRARGWEVKWLVYPQSKLAEKLEAESLPFESMKLRFLNLLNPLLTARLYQFLKAFAPQYLLLNASHELKTAGWVGKWAKIPHIIFRRGVSYPLSDSAWNHKMMNEVVTAFIGNSQATFKVFTDRFSTLLKKPHVYFNNAIDLSEFPQREARSPQHKIGIVARLAHEKGLDRAIEAMLVLKARGAKATLHIWGTGPESSNLLNLIREKELAEHVFLNGFTENIQEVLISCDLFAFPSRYGEGTAIALIEAMANGLPCVVFDTPALSEVVVDQETGYVVEDGDIEAYADALEKLLKHPDLAERMGKAGRKRAETHFSLDQLLD
ncbi:MAG: glycosyltransferase family 4 protein, partial [Bacteroidota bacterium]